MKKRRIIKSSLLFDQVINNGSKVSNKYYNVFYLPNNYSYPLFGIAVGKKIGTAVVRNKNKRQIKNIIDNNDYLVSNSYYYIIMLKKDIVSLNYNEKEKELKSLMSKGDKNEKQIL